MRINHLPHAANMLTRKSSDHRLVMRAGVLAAGFCVALAGVALVQGDGLAQVASAGQAHRGKTSAGHAKAAQAVAPVPAPPPPPNWPVNDRPNHASVVWDSHGLRIEASNSSLQQILREVSADTGTKVEGTIPDQRVYGSYGPGNARDVLSQLLQGSGYNILLAGDLGQGAPRQIFLTPRRAGGPGGAAQAQQPDQDSGGEEDVPENNEVDDQQPPQQPIPMVPNSPPDGNAPAGPGVNGPPRTPQQVMEEMQQRQQQLQQQLQQQQQQQQGQPTAPQQQPQ